MEKLRGKSAVFLNSLLLSCWYKGGHDLVAGKGVMRYHLMFCLVCQDDGTTTNPNLQAVLDDHDQPKEFTCVADVYKAQRQLGRNSRDLRYYAVEVSGADDLPAGRRR